MKEVKESIKHLPTKDDLVSLKDNLVTFKDEILGEIKSMREEVAVVTGYKDEIEDHETRIGKLEEILEPPVTTS